MNRIIGSIQYTPIYLCNRGDIHERTVVGADDSSGERENERAWSEIQWQAEREGGECIVRESVVFTIDL